MSFLIPNLVRTEVQSVGFLLRQTIQKVCSETTFTFLKSSSTTLDAPSYLFVSTSVSFTPLPPPRPDSCCLEMLRIIFLKLWRVSSCCLIKPPHQGSWHTNGTPPQIIATCGLVFSIGLIQRVTVGRDTDATH
jgi:hypothetical protein